jgi:cytochrome c biogenesis protein ResB
VIRKAWRAIVRFLSSAGLAVGLLVFVGVWSLLATLIAQGEAASLDVRSWATAHPLVEPAVRALGLHRAFTSWVFLGCVLLLGISTAVCAWRRTKAALSRARTLRSALRTDSATLAHCHDLEIPCDPGLSEAEVLSIASDALRIQGIRAKRQGDLLAAVSPRWSVWGSTVFHWALVALIVAIIVGQMVRSDGSMAVAVGQTKPDEPASYLFVQAGQWHDWGQARRSIHVDAMEPDYKTGGIDRGAVPTVSVLDGRGSVLVKQRVYPNSMLHSGSLAINAPAVGLSVWFASVNASGTETGRFIQPVDFSQTAVGGTVSILALTSRDAAGNMMRMSATVPLDRVGGRYAEWIPSKRTARVLVTTAKGKPLLDRVVRPDEVLALPGGGAVRLLGIGWYSRLSLVDDPTIPFLYATMIVAMLGLTMTLVFRQQLVIATFLKRPDGPVLAVRVRLWRNTSTNRGEIENALAGALRSDEKGSMS